MTVSLSRRRLVQSASSLAGAAALSLNRSSAFSQSTPDSTPETIEPVEALVRMSPQPGSRYALPATTIAFRGVTADQLGNVMVSGTVSGPSSGILREHSDGQGVSWINDTAFFDAEEVTVSAAIPLTTAADGTATFAIGEQSPRPSAEASEDTEPDPDVVHSFKSRPDLAPIKVDVTLFDDERTTDGLIAVTPHVPNGQAGATIYGNSGQPIWHNVAANPHHPIYCLKVQEYLEEPVLTWSEGAKRIGYGYAHFVIANDAYEPIAYVQGGNGVNGLDVHDMVLTDYGTAWAFSYHPVWTDDAGTRRNVLECVIQEIDVSTGDVWWEWHSLDHVPLDESYAARPDNPDNAWDYIHINSIEVDHDGGLLISSRTTHAIYRISTENHHVIWRLGGKESDFPLEPDEVFAWQHDARRLDDGTVSIFDNLDDSNEVDSRGMVFELDEDAMTATLVREYHRDGSMHSPFQANMQTLDNGNVFIGWGSGPRVSEFTHEGEMIFDMRYHDGISYRGYRVDWSAKPSRPIDYLVEDAADGSLTCFVSWNGATDIAEWAVMSDAEEVARVAKDGFETEITGIPISAHMEVQALDADGQVLGSRVLNRGQ